MAIRSIRSIREQTNRVRAAMQPTLRVKRPQAAILAVALGTVAGFAIFLLVTAAVHGSIPAAVLGAGVLYVFGQQLRQLLTWWQTADRTKQPIPISWELQTLSIVAAGVILAWLKFLITTWLNT
jgi:hypothetical protein